MSRSRLRMADAEQEVQLLTRIIETISAGLDLDEILQGVAGLITETTATDICFIHLLDDLGLAAILESLVHSIPDLDVRVDATSSVLPEHVETAIYRIAQEALQNVAKHASARRADIRLRTGADEVVLEVADDGRGFDPSTAPGPGGYGIPGMRERAEMLGGRLEFDSARGRGTVLRLRIPLARPL